jgi:GT2 family glycosyltransferase
MLYPIKIVDIELSLPLTDIEGLDGYMGLQGLVRLHGVPIGYVKASITIDRCTAKTLSKLILEQHSQKIINCLLENGLVAPPKPEGLRLEDLFDVPPPEYEGSLPLVTVAVCTRDRTSDLALCLDALSCLDYPYLDILVVDNAPTDDATKELVQTKYPHVRYVCEPRPGLDWARNRAIIEAKGEIIAYTDDDVVVDAGWVKALARVFAENPEVMAVTGLVVPYELETEAQVLFEHYGGFGRGFERKWYRVYPDSKMPWQWLGTGQFGTGANMAYRRRVFDEIGYFDPALDVGTVTNGGGDLEMFFRVLKEGHTLVYEPRALVRHRHRRDYIKLRTQIANNSIGLFSYCLRSMIVYPEERFSFFWLLIWWFVYWVLRRMWISFKHPTSLTKDLVQAEFEGCFLGLKRYQKSRQHAAEIASSFDSLMQDNFERKLARKNTNSERLRAVAVRSVDLSQPLQVLSDITNYSDVRIFISWKGELLGSVDIGNAYQVISSSRLIEVIVNQLGLRIIKPNLRRGIDFCWSQTVSAIEEKYGVTQQQETEFQKLPTHISVSINLATYDRPDDLRNCLHCLVAQKTSRHVEIIVVDNHPASGLTPPVVAEFPGVVLISESRQGLAYARNAGFAASTGDIVIATDDDVMMPPDWLEKLVAPFARPDVMIVTGNVLPLQLETIFQRFFERYGGLGRGFEFLEVSSHWFESFPRDAVPTWRLGATANAAFRASMFVHPQIGLMEEALGPGMPSGVGEDTYLFYKVLKAGYSLIYEPAAYVWHKHRRELSALRRQIYGYSKGHVAYNLATWLRDSDWRGLWRVLIVLPLVHLQRIFIWLRGRSDYPLSLILLEISGNLAGPWSLWQSYRRVRREGRSSPYIPPQERFVVDRETLLVETLQPVTVGNSQE